jgi:hypothetical protein
MKDRQLKIRQWFWFATDRIFDSHPWFESDKSDPFWTAYEFIEKNIAKVLCRIYGHRPERDQCGRPEHDFCLICNKLIPNSYEASNG